jgi:hypothetical protein
MELVYRSILMEKRISEDYFLLGSDTINSVDCFRGTCFLHLQGIRGVEKMEAAGSLKTLVTFQWIKWFHNITAMKTNKSCRRILYYPSYCQALLLPFFMTKTCH